MSRFHVRCKKCDKRRVLKRPPETYFKFIKSRGVFESHAPACHCCGHREYWLSNWMNSRNTKTASCDCAGYVHLTRKVWPYRKGSPYCWFRKDGTQRMEGDPDYRDSRQEEYDSKKAA